MKCKHLFHRESLFFLCSPLIGKLTFISTRRCSICVRSSPTHAPACFYICQRKSRSNSNNNSNNSNPGCRSCFSVCSEGPWLNPRVSLGGISQKRLKKKMLYKLLGFQPDWNQTLLCLMNVILAHLHHLKTLRKKKLFCCEDGKHVEK